jgi:hypothetical protein
MRLPWILDSSGELQLDGTFVSLRLVKDALEQCFRLIIKAERPHYLCCTLVRYRWLYASPLFWVQPTLHLHFRTDGSRAVLSWHFSRLHDYAVILVLPIYLGIQAFASHAQAPSSSFGLVLLCTLGFLAMTLLHTRLVSRRVQRVLAQLGERTT